MRIILTLIVFIPLLFSNAFAAVYQCKVNGKTIFSDKPCSPNAKKVEIFDRDEFHAADRQKALRNSQNNKAHDNKNKKRLAYEKRRSELNEEINSINLGLNQSLNSLLLNKRKQKQLRRQLKHLNASWLNYIDPEGAQERETDDKIENLQKEVKRLKKNSNATKSYTIQKNGRTTYCDESYGNVHCY